MAGLLGIALGLDQASTGPTLPSLPLFAAAQKDPEANIERFEKRPDIQRKIEGFRTAIAEAGSFEDLLENRDFMEVALSAYALESELQYPGRINKVLSQDPDDDDSLVKKLIDPRFKEIAEMLQFGTRDLDRVKLEGVQVTLIDKFITNEYEKDLGEQNPALREAMFFLRNVGNVEDVWDVLGDRTLRKVVLETLNIPVQIAFQSLDRQKIELDKRVDIEDFKDPEFVQKFIRRFLIQRDFNDQQAAFTGGFLGGGNSVESQLLAGAQRSGGFNILV